MAKKIGLDTNKAKEFLKQKGERVGLGAAGVLTLLILVLAFLGISTRPPASAGAPTWAEAINKAAVQLENKIRVHIVPDKFKEIDRKVTKETPFTLYTGWGHSPNPR